MLQESSQCLHAQTESKVVTVAISGFSWSDYGSTDKPALHRQTKTASIREEDHADKVVRRAHHGVDSVISSAILAFVTVETVPS
jgi:hypothetical protein